MRVPRLMVGAMLRYQPVAVETGAEAVGSVGEVAAHDGRPVAGDVGAKVIARGEQAGNAGAHDEKPAARDEVSRMWQHYQT